jgi:NADH-quinone oxidoreductase subunit L
VAAARKAFLMNVVGDVGLMVAIFYVATDVGSLRYEDILHSPRFQAHAFWICCGLLLAAYAKSAQLPLHTWLPDAMEGPTPVSALIHAATMVTAGVYLLVRCHPILESVQGIPNIIAWLGALTALVAACAALVQNDLKRILAYSTMSQLGYMFLAVGVGAYGAAIFHLVAHAFFKALLFLAAGAVIHSLHGEQDIRKMGALAKPLGVTWATFLIGALALAGLPPLVGFFSKEAILTAAFESPQSGQLLWGIGVLTALMTAYYTGRAYFLTFHGTSRHNVSHLHLPGGFMELPLVVLALLTVSAGAAGLGPRVLHDLGSTELEAGIGLVGAAVSAGLIGLGVAYSLHRSGADVAWPESIRGLLQGCFGFDAVYGSLFAAPMHRLSAFIAVSIDLIWSRVLPDFLGSTGVQSSQTLGLMQSGNLRMYALAVAAGVAIFILFAFICLHQMGSGGLT